MTYRVINRDTDLIIETFTTLKKAIKACESRNTKGESTSVVNSNGEQEW